MSEEAGGESQAQDKKRVGDQPGIPAAPYAEGSPGLPPRYGIPGSRAPSRRGLPGETEPDTLGLESPFGWLSGDPPFGRHPEDASPTGALAPLPPTDMGTSPPSAGLAMRPRLSSPPSSSGQPTQPTPMVPPGLAGSPEPGGPHGPATYGREREAREASYGTADDLPAGSGPGGYDQARTGGYADSGTGGYADSGTGGYGQHRPGGYGDNRPAAHGQNGPSPYEHARPDPYEQPPAATGHAPAAPGTEAVLSAPVPASARQATVTGAEAEDSGQHPLTVERTPASDAATNWPFRGTRLFARSKPSESAPSAGGSHPPGRPPGGATGSLGGQHAVTTGADAPGQRAGNPLAFGSTRPAVPERSDTAGAGDRPEQSGAGPVDRVTSAAAANRPGDDSTAAASTAATASAEQPSEHVRSLGGAPEIPGTQPAAAAQSLARQPGSRGEGVARGKPAGRPEPPLLSTDETATGHGAGGTQTSVLPPAQGSSPPGSTQPAGGPPGPTPAQPPPAPRPASAVSSAAAAGPAGGARSAGAGPVSAARPTAVVKGRVQISDAVVEKVAALASVEVSGVADLSFGGTRAREPAHDSGGAGQRRGIRVVRARVEDRQVWIDVAIAIEYGAVAIEVANAVKANVARVVNHMLGLRVIEVNITVDDVAVPLPARPGAHASGVAETAGGS